MNIEEFIKHMNDELLEKIYDLPAMKRIIERKNKYSCETIGCIDKDHKIIGHICEKENCDINSYNGCYREIGISWNESCKSTDCLINAILIKNMRLAIYIINNGFYDPSYNEDGKNYLMILLKMNEIGLFRLMCDQNKINILQKDEDGNNIFHYVKTDNTLTTVIPYILQKLNDPNVCIEYLDKNINFLKNVYSRELYMSLMNWRKKNSLSKENLRFFPKIFFSVCKGIIDKCDNELFQDIILNNLFDVKKYFNELPINNSSLMILKAIKFNGQCLCDKITIGLIEYFEEKDLPLHFSGLDYSHHKNTSLQNCRLDYIKLAITYNHKCCNGNLHYWVNSLCKMNEENDIVYLLDTNFPDGQIKFDNISGEGLLIYACMNKMTRLIPKIIDYNPNECIKINYGSAPEQIIMETALNSCIKNRLVETAIYLVDKMEKSVIELWDREGAGRHNSLTLTMQFIPSDHPLKEILVEKLLNC